MDENQDTWMTVERQSQLNELKEQVDLWYKRMIQKKPQLNDGECMSIEFSGGMDGFLDDDQEAFSISVTTSENKNF